MKTAVLCLSPAYFNAGQRAARLLCDAWFYPSAEWVTPDRLPSEGVERVVLVGTVPEAVTFLCEGGLTGLASSELPAVVLDPDCRFVSPLTEGGEGGSNRLAAFLAGTIRGTAIIPTGSPSSLWRLDKLAAPYEWTMAVRGEIDEIVEYFYSFQPTALLIELRDRGTRYLLSSLPGHVDLFYSVDDIPQEAYGLIIAVTPRILPSELAQRIVTYIPRCLLPLEMAGNEVRPWPHHSSTPLDLHSVLSLNGYHPEALANPTTPELRSMNDSGDYGPQLFSRSVDGEKDLIVTMLRRFVRQGHIEVVEINSRDASLVTVRGADFIRNTDLLIYPGLRTPRALLDWRPYGSGLLNIDEVTEEELRDTILAYYDRGLLTTWLLPPETSSLLNPDPALPPQDSAVDNRASSVTSPESYETESYEKGPDLDPSRFLSSLDLPWSLTPGLR